MLKYIIVVGILLLSGCIDESVIGTYTHDGAKLVLQSDGTYLYTPENGIIQKGTYSAAVIDDLNLTEIQLTSILGTTTVLQTTKTGLIDDENDIWIKQ